MFEMKITGLKEVMNKLENLKKKSEELDGKHQLKFSELFNPDFMKHFTKFDSIDLMFEKSNFKIENTEDFKAIPEDKINEFVKNNTSFTTWAEMQEKAVAEWTKSKLEL